MRRWILRGGGRGGGGGGVRVIEGRRKGRKKERKRQEQAEEGGKAEKFKKAGCIREGTKEGFSYRISYQQQDPVSVLFFPAELAVSSTMTRREAVRVAEDEEDDEEELSLSRFDNIPGKIEEEYE